MAGKADFITKLGAGNITYDFTEKEVTVYFDSKVAASLKWSVMKYQYKEMTAQGWAFWNSKARWGNF